MTDQHPLPATRNYTNPLRAGEALKVKSINISSSQLAEKKNSIYPCQEDELTHHYPVLSAIEFRILDFYLRVGTFYFELRWKYNTETSCRRA